MSSNIVRRVVGVVTRNLYNIDYWKLTSYINSWSNTSKFLFMCTSSLLSLVGLYKYRQYSNEYELYKNGYRLLPSMSQNWHLQDEVLKTPGTVCGFEISSDKYTISDLKNFIQQIMKSFINFRSQIYKKNDKYYYKEEFNPNSEEEINKYVTKIDMKYDNFDGNDSNKMMEEKILQKVVKYLNNKKAFNVQWSTYKRAHFDTFYFHFKSIKKCVIYIRLNHILGDGILLSTVMSLISHQMSNNKFSNTDYTKINHIMPLMNDFLKNIKAPNYSYSTYLQRMMYYYLDMPTAWMNFVKNMFTQKPETNCVFRGDYESNTKLAIGEPIPVEQFKSVAHKHNGTVNDLFQALTAGALKRYAEKYKCPIFGDSNFDGKYTALGIISYRSLSPNKLAKSLQKYATNGCDGNQFYCCPYKMTVKQPTINEMQKSFNPIKYGYTPRINEMLINLMSMIPDRGSLMKKMATEYHTMSPTVILSNLRGPSNLVPIPKVMDNDNNNNDKISWLFGMGTPCTMPMNFTLMTYNKHIRVGIMVDEGSVKYPDVLMQCFVDEWNQYNL